MFMKFITKSIRPLGMFLISLFAAWCILGSTLVRDMSDEDALSQFLQYTTSFENRFYDYRMRLQLTDKEKSKEIVLLKIDDYSLEKIGMWPIPRTLHAKMINKLKNFGAKVIALDILYPEASPVCGENSPDDELARAFKNFQTDGARLFLGYSLTQDPAEALKEAPAEMLNDAVMTQSVPNVDMAPQMISRFTFPIEKFVQTEAGIASITSREDLDGVFRQYQLISNIDTIYYGSLALNSYKAFVGDMPEVKISKDATGELKLNDKILEIYNTGETKIRYIGGTNYFPEVGLYDLLIAKDDDQKMKSVFENKIVFIGSTAQGAHDLRPSPLDAKMPGVYSHMNMSHMLLHQYFYQNSNDSVKYSLILMLSGMFIFLLTQRLGNAFLDAAVIILLVVGSSIADTKYFLPQGHEMKLFYCFFCFVTSYVWNTFILFYEANKEKKQIKGTFSRYVAPAVVNEMLKDPDKLQIGGEKMDITCLFSDVRDFTSISEGLSATELSQSMNMYMTKMTDIVFETKGTLDKYIGDAIVAIWGAPLPIGNHAQFAVTAAIGMMEALPAINEEFKRLNRPEFKIGIGLNSGECSVGNMGSDRIFSYTALGDNMNLGARLESLCKHYGAQILISEYTFAKIDSSQMKIRPIDKVIVKGKTKPVAIYEVLHKFHPLSLDPEALNFYLGAHAHFQNKEFKEALDIFGQVLMAFENDKPTKRLRDICQKYVDQPELVDDYFDVTKMTEK